MIEYPCTLSGPKIIYFNGVKYFLGSTKKYYLATFKTSEQRKKAVGLHVSIWEFYNNKKIKKGFHVHHIDGNSLNNNPQNLEMISKEDHISKTNYKTEAVKINLDKIRPLAIAWHKSDEGRAWHKKHYENSLKKAKKYDTTCIVCSKLFQSKSTVARFCSHNCGEKWRYVNCKKEYTYPCFVCQTVTTKLVYGKKPTHCSKRCVGITASGSKNVFS